MLLKISSFALVAICFVSTLAGQAVAHKFDFRADKPVSGRMLVRPNDNYDKTKGYGFEPNAAMKCGSDSCTSDKPFYFSAAVPEGNYRVTVRFGNAAFATAPVVKAELRRLMLEGISTAPGKFVTTDFIVNVRSPMISTKGSVPPAVAGGETQVKLKDREKLSEQWAWDEKLTLEFNGAQPSISSIEIEPISVPTIFLLGDSTVCDQPGEPYASWGQMFTRFFTNKVAVANHAESGESLKSSFGAKRLDKVLSLIKPGDYLLIQYGHNDMKEKGDGIGAFTSYKASLKQFTEAARAKGASVMLVNPMHRRTFDSTGKFITNSHGDYPEAVRQAAKEENVPLIDLTAMSKDLYEALGKDGSGVLFKEGDGTHHNNYGSYQLAKIIVQSIRDQKLPLAKFLKGLPKYDPKKPDDLKTFAIPASPAVTYLKPLGS
ncbi:MAG: rhamnogalacturonan acetylesterase [Pyrinomonadaceae bacterium]